MIFKVTFKLESYYDDESNNLTGSVLKEFDADNLDALFEILDDMDEIDSIDDTSVINLETDDSPDEVNIEYVLINDDTGKEVYRDEDYK